MSTLGGGFNPVAAIANPNLNPYNQGSNQDSQGQQPPETPGEVVWEFPVKGLDTNFAYRDQPPGTTPSCLNVIPYDPTSLRARGGPRPGTVKAFPSQGAMAGEVIQMIQATYEQIENIIVNEDFAYPAGNLEAVSNGAWVGYQGGGNTAITNSLPPTTGPYVDGNESMFMGTHLSAMVNTSDGTATFAVTGTKPQMIVNTATANDSQVDPPSGLIAGAISTTGGFLLQNTTYYYVVTAINAAGETTVSNEASLAIGATGTNTNVIAIFWQPVAGATGYKIYRSTTSGAELFIASVASVQDIYFDNTNVTPAGSPPSSNTTGLNIGAVYTASLSFIITSDTTSASSRISIASRLNPNQFTDGTSGVKFFTCIQAYLDLTAGNAQFLIVEVSSTGGNRVENVIATGPVVTQASIGFAFGTECTMLVDVTNSAIQVSFGAGITAPTNIVLQASSAFNTVYGGVGISGYQYHSGATVGIGLLNITVTSATNLTPQSNTLISDLFQYGNGQALQTASAPSPPGPPYTWQTSINGPVGQAGNGAIGTDDTGTGNWYTTGTSVQATNTGGSTHFQNGGAWAEYIPGVGIGSLVDYTVNCTFQYLSISDGFFYMLVRFGNASGPNKANGVFVQYAAKTDGTCTVAVVDDTWTGTGAASTVGPGVYGVSAALSSTFAAHGIPIPMIVQVTASVITVFIGNNQVLSCTCTYGTGSAGAKKTGFGAMATTSNTFTVYQFYVQNILAVASFRQTSIIAAAGGSVYVGSAVTVGSTPQYQTAQYGANALSTVYVPAMCYADGTVYIVDGINTFQLNMTTQVLSMLVATAGSIPSGCQLACIWHGRLFLARQTGQEQSGYLSRIGTYTDFNFGAPSTDPARAIPLTSGQTFGKIGDEITALMPLSDDICLIGCVNQLFGLVGDPAAGGIIDHFLRDAGVYGPDAFCYDSIGTLYWIGSGGLFRLPKGYTIPQCISQNVIQTYFAGIDRNTYRIVLRWYQDCHQLWIMVSPYTPGIGAAQHLFWDERTGGFFPQEFGVGLSNSPQDPFSAIVYQGDHPTDRRVLMGCRDGYVRKYHSNVNLAGGVLSDDGTAITSNVTLGPNRLIDDENEGKILSAGFYMGNDVSGYTYNMNYQIQTAPDFFNAVNNPVQTVTGTTSQQGYFRDRNMRVKGGVACMILSNSTLNTTFSFERIVLSNRKGAIQRAT